MRDGTEDQRPARSREGRIAVPEEINPRRRDTKIFPGRRVPKYILVLTGSHYN